MEEDMSFWEQVKEKTEAIPLKLKMIFLENNIEALFLRLGSRVYDLSKTPGNASANTEIQSLLAGISAKKKELEGLKENFHKIWREEARELKVSLEKGGGALEQIAIDAGSPAEGRQVKELTLPKEVLLGPILRGKNLIIPDGETVIAEGDRVTLMGTKKDLGAAKRYLHGAE
jgi:K+/H+ antiporter YhaU regulatory subunit KhtT